MDVAVPQRVHVSIVERDEIALDAVSLMAARLGASVSIYVDARTARWGIPHSKPSILLVEPRHLDCNLADFVGSLHSGGGLMGVVLMTTLSADELRATCLPICWHALLHKPFTYSRFEGVMRFLLADMVTESPALGRGS